MLKIMFRKETFLLLVITLCFGGMFGTYVSFGKNYAASVGLSYGSILYSTYAGGAILARFFIRPLTDHLTPSHMIPFGLAGIGVSLFLLGFSDTYTSLGIMGLLYGLSHGILYPTLVVRFIDAQRPSEIGRATIIVQGSFSGGWGLFPWLGGILVQHSSFPSLFSLLTAVSGLCIFIHLITERYRHRGLLNVSE